MSSMHASSAVSRAQRPVAWGRYALIGVATIVAAVVANVLVYYIGRAIVTYDPEFVVLRDVGATIMFTAVPALVAVLLYAALLRFSGTPARTFTVIAAVVLVLSLLPDLFYIPGVPGASTAQVAVLMIMHVVAAVVIVGMLTNLTHHEPR